MSNHRGTLRTARALCERAIELCERARAAERMSRRAIDRSVPVWDQRRPRTEEIEELGARMARLAAVAELLRAKGS